MVLDKFRSRIVAGGFLHKERIDYNESNASTARFSSWGMLMALSAIKEWHILQAYFIAVDLWGDLKEVIYMNHFSHLAGFFS